MAPKRAQPPPAPLPTGTAFRKRQRKGAEDANDKVKTKPVAQQTQKQARQNSKIEANKRPGHVSSNGAHAPSQPKSILKNGKASAQAPQSTLKGKGKAKEEALEDDISTKTHSLDWSPPKKTRAKRTGKQKANTAPVQPRISSSLRMIVGSYERLLYGYHVTLQKGECTDADSTPLHTTFEPLFSFAAHTSSISAVAAAGADSKWLATGAGDETVRVWDLRRRKEVGGLTGHAGTIHSLSFPTRTYMISADGSGLINIYRTRDWALLKTLRGHAGRVNACVAHPSGKVALSVGQDGMLRMWDLMRGKGAGAVRVSLGQGRIGAGQKNHDEPLDVQWNGTGSRFAVLARTEVAVYTTDMQNIMSFVVRRDDPKHKFLCMAWLQDDTLLIGNEAGEVDVRHLPSSIKPDATNDADVLEPTCRLIGHNNRVKGVRVIQISLEQDIVATLAVTASSDGKIRIFDISDLARKGDDQQVGSERRLPIGVKDTGGARLTTLDIVGGSGQVDKGIDGGDFDDEEEEAENDDLSLLSKNEDGDASKADADMDPRELEELNALLDIIDEAREQGIDVEGLSDFDGLAGDGSDDASDEEVGDVLDDYDDGSDGAESFDEEDEEEIEEDEDEAEEEEED